MSNQAEKRGASAIVIGASMAGLLAARALANHFEQVTLLERDVFPARGENRRGVPQGRHTHVLLERGRQIMESFFPGLTEELLGLGAVEVRDASLELRWFRGGYHQPGASGIRGITLSRPTLEAVVRESVMVLPNVRAVEGCKVLGPVPGEDHVGRVAGVRVAAGEGGGEETMYADLVVDASGRGSRSPAWLEELGYEPPVVDQVEVRVGYTTYYFRREPQHLRGLSGVVVAPVPPDRRMGVMLGQDGNRWVVTIGGYLGDHVPADYQAFVDAARALPVSEIYDVVKDADLLGEPATYKYRASVRHRYEALDRFPEGYLVLGDALCSFNPIYGQGMTVAALEAAALDECLAGGRHRLAQRFFARATPIVEASWNAATGNDLAYPEVEGRRTPLVRFFNRYLDKLHVAAHHDAGVSIAFLKVINMLAPAPSILHPRIVWRVVKGNVAASRRRRGVGNEIVDGEGIAIDVPDERVEPSHQALKEHAR
ncbi:MAG TPA: monooxygenase [Anaerolineae bacterium]|nr:monooxygenase [Anaerolineae bacterium]